jgi:hypothetical protein
LATALAAALLAGSFVADAQAGKKKAFIKARIDGKGFKAKHIPLKGKVATAATNGFGAYAITGTITTAGRRGGTLRNVTLGCEIPDLSPSSAFPITVSCGGGYTDTKVTLSGTTIRAWGTDDMIQVTITAFDGTRMTGTWSGQFEEAGETNPGDPPAVVENGKLSVDVLTE